MAEVVAEVVALVVRPPTASDEVGPMLSATHVDRVTGFLDRAREAGIRACQPA